MDIRKLLALLLSVWLLLPLTVCAKTPKPSLLVYGDNIEAFAAAVQSSRSNIPTVWVIPASSFAQECMRNQLNITSNDMLDGGIWLDVLKRMSNTHNVVDSVIIATKRHLNPQDINNVLQEIIQQEKNLKIVYQACVKKMSFGKSNITVQLSNKEKYEVRSIVDASSDEQLKPFLEGDGAYLKPSKILPITNLTVAARRTLVAMAEYDKQIWGYTLSDMLSRQHNKIFFTASLIQVASDENSIPLRIQVGQAMGAIAGYCAFFKTTIDKIDVRKLQSELLGFGTRLLPYRNISSSDANYLAIQRIYLTGLYSNEDSFNQYDRSSQVYISNIQATILHMSSRSQLWFKNSERDQLDLAGLISLIKNISFRGDELDQLIEKEWHSKLKFERAYDKKLLSRYEFEVILDRYANPFSKTIDQSGNIMR